MKLLLPVARSCRVSFWLVFHRAWPDLQRMKLLLPGGAVLPGQCLLSFPPGLARPAAHETSATVARSYRVSFFLVFHRAWPDLQRMKLLLPGGAVLPGKFLPRENGILVGRCRSLNDWRGRFRFCRDAICRYDNRVVAITTIAGSRSGKWLS